MNATATRPSLETLAGLYRAALQQSHESAFALARIRDSITRHGFTEEQVREAACIHPASVTTLGNSAHQ
jgi:hypothetical protein